MFGSIQTSPTGGDLYNYTSRYKVRLYYLSGTRELWSNICAHFRHLRLISYHYVKTWSEKTRLSHFKPLFLV